MKMLLAKPVEIKIEKHTKKPFFLLSCIYWPTTPPTTLKKNFINLEVNTFLSDDFKH